ncbi:hypothetical protein [Aurantiacibacter hainanensis]|uniref:hypothetical protein n=1 Tax=Aurantiacibacter hainanensis TaxID=3076114 RepID=UPI0030C6E8C5
MTSANDTAAAALKIMRQWDWRNYDPDGNEHAPSLDLHSVVSRLAIEGVRRPQAVILQLLCQGDLLSRGGYRWRKYQDFSHYEHEEWNDQIKARHWQHLAEAIKSSSPGGVGSFMETTLQLHELDLKDCPAHEWDTANNSCGYARVTDKLDPWDDDYMEEWFSASSIEVWPQFLHEPSAEEVAQYEMECDTNGATQGRGRSAAKWWPDFAEELSVYIHEEGIPEGSGHEGQSALIDAVFERLVAAGKTEPGRATVQPVINAVLQRIRSAGK